MSMSFQKIYCKINHSHVSVNRHISYNVYLRFNNLKNTRSTVIRSSLASIFLLSREISSTKVSMWYRFCRIAVRASIYPAVPDFQQLGGCHGDPAACVFRAHIMCATTLRGAGAHFLAEKPSPVGSRSQGQLLGHSMQVKSRSVSPGSSRVVSGQAFGNEQQGWPFSSHFSFQSSKSRRLGISVGVCIHLRTCAKTERREFLSQ